MQASNVLFDVNEILSKRHEMSDLVCLLRLISAAPNIEAKNPQVIRIFKDHILWLANHLDSITPKHEQELRRYYGYDEKSDEEIYYKPYRASLSSLFPNIANYLCDCYDDEILSALNILISVEQASLYDRLAVAAMYYYATGHLTDEMLILFKSISDMDVQDEWKIFHNYISYTSNLDFYESQFTLEKMLSNIPVPLPIMADWLKNELMYYDVSNALQKRFVSPTTELRITVCNQAIHSLGDIRIQLLNKTRVSVRHLDSIGKVLEVLTTWQPNASQKHQIIIELEQLILVVASHYSENWWLKEEAIKYLNQWKKLDKKDVVNLPIWDKFVWYLQEKKITWNYLLEDLKNCEVYHSEIDSNTENILQRLEADSLQMPSYDNCEHIINELLYESNDLIMLPISKDENYTDYIEQLMINLLSTFVDVKKSYLSPKFHMLNQLDNSEQELYFFEYKSKNYAYSIDNSDAYRAYIAGLTAINNFLNIIKSKHSFYLLDNHDNMEMLLVFSAKKKEFSSLQKKLAFPAISLTV